jgi:hypothetical protein
MAGRTDLCHLLLGVREIAVCVASRGRLQDHVLILLRTEDGAWQFVAFSDPAVPKLMSQMRALPGFDTDVLLDAISAPTAQIDVIWPTPSPAQT